MSMEKGLMDRETTTTIPKATTSSHGQRRQVLHQYLVIILITRTSSTRTPETDLTLPTILA